MQKEFIMLRILSAIANKTNCVFRKYLNLIMISDLLTRLQVIFPWETWVKVFDQVKFAE